MEIKEISDKITKTFGKNGSMIALGIGGIVVAYLILSNQNADDGESSELVNAVAYASYPDAVTNANVIMGEVNNHTTTEIGNLQDKMEERFDKVDTGNEQIQEKIDTSTESITNKIDSNTQQIIKNNTDNKNSIITTVNNNTAKLQTEIKSNKATKKKSTKSSTKYYKKTSIKNGSIVDTLKKIGVNSSFSNRKKIAKANGIKNYVGSSSQNIKMLNLLKTGKLKKA